MTNIPKYLTEVFTGIFSIVESLDLCKDKISHLDMFSLRPEACENWLIRVIIFES